LWKNTPKRLDPVRDFEEFKLNYAKEKIFNKLKYPHLWINISNGVDKPCEKSIIR